MIERLAELSTDDVVLEIGPGRGILTRFLAERVALVHAVEIDRSLEPHLPASDNVELHWGDALALDLAALEPTPGKLVANLPYNVATPIVVESLDGLPERRALVRDGAARGRRPLLRAFRARRRTERCRCSCSSPPNAPAGIPVSREVFRPRPNVDSALVAFRRTRAAGGLASRQAHGRGGLRAPPEDAAELARAQRRRDARSSGSCDRARSDASPTRAQRRSSRTSSSRSHDAL